VLLVILSIGVGLIYQFAGLNSYLKTLKYIRGLQGDQKTLVEDRFFGPGKMYGGILALVDPRGVVWVWGEGGLRNFPTDKYSKYTFLSGCVEETIEAINNSIYTEIESWKKVVQVGDFITILPSDENGVGEAGNLRVAYTSRRWSFMQKDREIECVR
jgi:hypothetical protein